MNRWTLGPRQKVERTVLGTQVQLMELPLRLEVIPAFISQQTLVRVRHITCEYLLHLFLFLLIYRIAGLSFRNRKSNRLHHVDRPKCHYAYQTGWIPCA